MAMNTKWQVHLRLSISSIRWKYLIQLFQFNQKHFRNYSITSSVILKCQEDCMERIHAGELYNLRNEAKLKAVNTTQSYEEFKDIVDAAHLRAISKQDKMNAKTKQRLWNSAARED